MEKAGIEEEVAEVAVVAVAGEPPGCYRVGCALTKKKQTSFLTPSLLSHALRRSISLIPIDPDLPISSQGGPFHLILHKLPSTHPYWTSHLLSFAAANPGVPVVDEPLAIARLYNRVSMLEAASDLFSSSSSSAHRKEILDVPRQIVVEDGWVSVDSLLGDLSFPFIAKPLVSDGRAGSHDLALVLGKEGLLKLNLPVILQEFVNHGGVLFKVYVIDNYVKCVKRRSLPDVNEGSPGCNEGFVPFSQISNTPSQKDQITQNLITPGMPSSGFIEDVARGLSEATGLRLFNFDLIQDTRVENRYLVIDINYFPGYEKIPSYEDIFTEFLWSILRTSEC